MLHKRGLFPLAGDFKWQFFPVACASVCLCMWSFPVAPYCQLIVKHSLQTLSPGFKIALFRRDLLGNRGWVLVMEWSEVAEVERKRRERRGDRVDRTQGLQTQRAGTFSWHGSPALLIIPKYALLLFIPPLWQTTQGLF